MTKKLQFWMLANLLIGDTTMMIDLRVWRVTTEIVWDEALEIKKSIVWS